MLYDYNGRLIKKSELTGELAEPSLTGVRTVWHDSVANALTPEALGNILIEVDQGDSLSYLTLAEEMEERYMHYNSVIGTRKRAITGLEIMVESRSDDAQAVKIAEAVRELVETEEFRGCLFDIMDGVGKGYSATEILWDRSGNQWMPAKYKWRDPRFFVFDRDAGSELRMRDESDIVDGIPLPPFKFIVHRPKVKSGLTLRSGLARAACVGYMLQGYTLKDWWAFMEVFGMPWRVGKYATSATADQKNALLSALRQMGVDAACIIPEDMNVEIVEAAKVTGGDRLFPSAADFIDDRVSELVIGQTASTRGTPGKLGAEDVQENVRKDIKVDDAEQLNSTIRRDLIKPFVDLNFGPQKLYPHFYFVTDEPEDVAWLREKLPDLVDRGLKIQMSEVRDKLGFEDPEDEADILQPKSSAGPQPPAEAKPGEPEPPESPDKKDEKKKDEEEEKELKRERRKAIIAVLQRLKNGEMLSTEERQLLFVDLALTRGQRDDDEIDDLVDDELDEWQKLMDPVLKPILDHAKRSGSYEEFLNGLEEAMAQMDSTVFAERLAVAMFKARGHGDATDDL